MCLRTLSMSGFASNVRSAAARDVACCCARQLCTRLQNTQILLLTCFSRAC